MAEILTQKERKELLKIARNTIVSYVSDGKVPPAETASKGLNAENGCFVTIKQQGQLRGCIGNFTSDKPLFKLVQEMAVSAATRDPRFYPMKCHDLNDFDLEISVLSPLEQISSIDEIQVGKHGLYIVKNISRGVLLPQVAREYGWDRETFLRHACIKAGLPEDAWQKECDIYVFSALVFGET
jgi:AmmeMemoRadiSam system protein A